LKTLKQAFTRPGTWVFVLVGAAAFLLLLSTYVRVYSPEYGITSLLQIGSEFNDRGLAVFRATPKYIAPSSRWGFDGQLYAELGLDPLLRDPQLKIALDNPSYRSRRILMPWLAWLGGLGRPFWILNVYAALNLVFWMGFVAMMAVLFRPHGWSGLAGFAAMLMTCGIIESMRSSLTDFPGFVLMTLAMMIGGAGGAGVLALSALTREPNIIGVVGLFDYRPPWLAAARRNLILGLIAGLPIALWFAYVLVRFPPQESLAGGNLTWPLQGIMAKLGEFSVHAANGDVRWSHWYSEIYSNEALHALLTIVATLTQCIFLFTHREWDNRIWRAGAVFVPYFLCISFIPWESHFTVTRHALPITLAFNLILAMRPRRGWLAWFLLGNCFVPYGVWLFAIQAQGPAFPPSEYRIQSTETAPPAVGLRFDQGWSDEEWNRRHTWRWGTASHATLTLSNAAPGPVEVSLSFVTRSVAVRDLRIRVRGVDLWSVRSLQSKQQVQTPRFAIPKGDTVVDFDSSGVPVGSGNWNDDRRLSFMVEDIRLDLATAPPGG
jgi:hypothetical protein